MVMRFNYTPKMRQAYAPIKQKEQQRIKIESTTYLELSVFTKHLRVPI